MHTRTLDFRTVLKDRLRPPDQPHNKESTQGAIVKPGREGPTISVQLRVGLPSPSRTVTPPYGRGRHVHRQCLRHLVDYTIYDVPPDRSVNLRGIE
jgi:hypothetical protein